MEWGHVAAENIREHQRMLRKKFYITPYRENEIYGENFTEPPPELVEGEEVYEVETIHGHRKQGQGYQYYIQFWGYPISDASW